jgi:hypothetical protein
MLRLFTVAEREQRFSAVTPTRADFDRFHGDTVPRWAAHAVVLHDNDGKPSHLGIWSASGD